MRAAGLLASCGRAFNRGGFTAEENGVASSIGVPFQACRHLDMSRFDERRYYQSTQAR